MEHAALLNDHVFLLCLYT